MRVRLRPKKRRAVTRKETGSKKMKAESRLAKQPVKEEVEAHDTTSAPTVQPDGCAPAVPGDTSPHDEENLGITSTKDEEDFKPDWSD